MARASLLYRYLLPCLLLWLSINSWGLPVYARQTGLACAGCHAGGQYPELNTYGRIFKLTGYTMGNHTTPLSAMLTANANHVTNRKKSDEPSSDFQKDDQLILGTGSLFLAGKITDHIGAFTQATYDPYASESANGKYHGHSQADNIDIRYANLLNLSRISLLYGIALNNNPSVTDPWNSSPAWMQYVPTASPTSYQFTDANSPYPRFASGGNITGLNLYSLLNNTLYTEIGFYRTANKSFSWMSAGVPNEDTTKLDGSDNPYWRVALTHDWDRHSIMLGAGGMVARMYDPETGYSQSTNLGKYVDKEIDSQYHYFNGEHTATAQFSWMHGYRHYSASTLSGAPSYFMADGTTPVQPYDSSDTNITIRGKASYVFQSKYGAGISYFRLTGTTNTLNQTSGYDSLGQITSNDPHATGISSTRVTGNLTGNPYTRGLTYELFWMPIQNIRFGIQWTQYFAFNGAAHNYDGFGRNANDNNTLLGYCWAAF